MVTGTEDPLEESEPRIRVVVTDCVLPSAGLPDVLAVIVQGLTVIFCPTASVGIVDVAMVKMQEP